MLISFNFPAKRPKHKSANLNRWRVPCQSLLGVVFCLLLVPSHSLFAQPHSVQEFQDMFDAGTHSPSARMPDNPLFVGGVSAASETSSGSIGSVQSIPTPITGSVQHSVSESVRVPGVVQLERGVMPERESSSVVNGLLLK